MTSRSIASCVLWLCAVGVAAAQSPPANPNPPATNEPKPADAKPAEQTANPGLIDGVYRFVITEATGTVKVADLSADPTSESGWTAVKVGDILGPGQQLKTGMRSKVKFVMEPANPPSIIMLGANGNFSIDELAQEQAADGAAVRTRLGVAYGEVRAGVAESGLRSDLQIRSPVATLAKKGTWDFSFFAERGTGNFKITLADRGLVQAIQNATGRQININPGQFVNQLMNRWIDTVKWSRPINIQDWYGLKGSELVFNLANQTGLGVFGPGGSLNAVLRLNTPQNQLDFANVLRNELQRLGEGGGAGLPQNPFSFDQFGPRRRPEGDFGVGLGAIPIIVDGNNPLVQRGAMQAGRIDVWKAQAQQFLKQHDR